MVNGGVAIVCDRSDAVRTFRRGELFVLIVAAVPRLGFVLYGAGLRGTYGYDPSVYYAASDALLHGRLPYRDYVLLHPPAIVLLLTPFAKVGELTSDHAGFIMANLAFTLVGCVNAALVVRVSLRMGLDRRAALIGGLVYAVWLGSVGAEYLIRLEPLGNFFLLCGLLAFYSGDRPAWRRTMFLCGAAFGAAAAVKIWWVVPLVIVLAWHLPARRRGRFLLVAGGAATSMLAIYGPFFLAAPGQMWTMIVTDQLHRNGFAGGLTRLSGVSAVRQLAPHLSRSVAVAVVGVTALAFVTACVAAWRVRQVRVVIAVLVAQMAVLASSPSWFPFYDDYLAPALALTIAAALRTRRTAGAAAPSTRQRSLVSGVVAVVTATAAVACIVAPVQAVQRYPSTAFAAAVRRVRCVMSDSPMSLIEMNVLTRDLSNGCRNWVDVTGRTYGVDAPTDNSHDVATPRARNARWQCDLTRYLLLGDAITLFRASDTGIGSTLRSILARKRVLARAFGLTVVANPPTVGPRRPPARPCTDH